MNSKFDFAGNLNFLCLGDVMQLIGSNGSSGVLHVVSRYAPCAGVIYFDKGNPIDARSGSLTGLDAVYALFGWTEGRFKFTQQDVRRANTVRKSRMAIILDGLKMLDDGQIKALSPVSCQEKAMNFLAGKTEAPFINGPLVDYLYVVDEEEFSDGEKIVRQGKYGSWIWVILDGVAEIVKETSEGPVTILRIGNGAFIGSVAAFLTQGSVRSASAIAAGKIQLGVLDTQRIFSEYACMSMDLRGIILSLDRRLKWISERAAEIYSNNYSLEESLDGWRPVIKQGDSQEKIFTITEGEAFLVRRVNKGYLKLINLRQGDFIGHMPFFDMGHEPSSAGVYGSENLQVSELDRVELQQEYDQLSATLKNIIGNVSDCLAATTSAAIHFIEKTERKKT